MTTVKPSDARSGYKYSSTLISKEYVRSKLAESSHKAHVTRSLNAWEAAFLLFSITRQKSGMNSPALWCEEFLVLEF